METIQDLTKKAVSLLTTQKDSELYDRQCVNCLVQFKHPEKFTLDVFCPDCSLKRRVESELRAKQRNRDGLESSWKAVCPKIFIETNVEKLPNRAAHDSAMRWAYSQRGLLLHGKTGTGKSRTAWAIAKREHFNGKQVMVINSSSAIRYAAMFGESSKEAMNWIDKTSRCDLLLMDDAFKVKLTESYEAAIFAIVDGRMENAAPIIATTNDTGDTLLARMSEDRGAAFLRRLRESCDVVNF